MYTLPTSPKAHGVRKTRRFWRGMPLFVKFAYWEAVLLFGGFLGVVLLKLLTGRSL